MSKTYGTDDKLIIVFIFLVLLGGIGFVHLATVESDAHRAAVERFNTRLEEAGLTIVEGIIQSPSVIIKVDSPEEFMSIVKESQQSTVYYDPNIRYLNARSYYVFNDDMTIAWRYIPKGRDFR